jgi:lipoprotein signal peptidase
MHNNILNKHFIHYFIITVIIILYKVIKLHILAKFDYLYKSKKKKLYKLIV